MNHADVRGHMADYLEGDLDLSRRARVDAHLDGCEACRAELKELRGTVELLRALPDPEPPADLADQVMRRIRQGEGRRSAWDRARDWLGELASPRVALPATMVAAGLLLATGRLDLSLVALERMLGGSGESPAATRVAQGERNEAGLIGTSSRAPVWRPSPVVVAHREPRVPRISLQMKLDEVGSKPLRGAAALPDAGSFRAVARTPVAATPGVAGRSRGPLLRPAANAATTSTLAATDALDPRLEALILHPRAQAHRFDALTVAEQEIWLEALAEGALASGRHEQVLSSLRAVGDSRALALATAFSAEIDRLVADDAGAVATAGARRR